MGFEQIYLRRLAQMELGSEKTGDEDARPEEVGGSQCVATCIAMHGIEHNFQTSYYSTEHRQGLHDQDVVLVMTTVHLHQRLKVKFR